MLRPNRLRQADWKGWVQERGLYFARSWDPAYRPVLETHDPGEAPLEGGLLVARWGKGTYVYTGLSFFRQLPAGVPGAFRLFANLLALRRATACAADDDADGSPGVRRPAAPLAVVLLTSACGSDGRTPVVLYSPHGRDQLTLLEHAFERQRPDIDVRWLDMGSQEILDRLRFERVNPQADVWFGGPTTIFDRGVQDSLLAPYRPAWADSVGPRRRRSGRPLLPGLPHAGGDRLQQPAGAARRRRRGTGTRCSQPRW